jgi:death-on-curing protein
LTQYLTVVEVLAIHALMIEEFGGPDGVRDLGALESVVFRPQTGYYDDAIAEAAALLESIVQNHPFIDGNKRTAVAAADVHLRMNGLELGGDSVEHHRIFIGLMEAGALDWKAIDAWLRSNVEFVTFGSGPALSPPSREEWSREQAGDQSMRQATKRSIGKDLSTPLSAAEAEWLDQPLEEE